MAKKSPLVQHHEFVCEICGKKRPITQKANNACVACTLIPQIQELLKDDYDQIKKYDGEVDQKFVNVLKYMHRKLINE